MKQPTITEIDQLLPQTQCGLCGYGGCKPYAEAITQGESINLCPPGGVDTLQALAAITHTDAGPMLTEMQAKTKPNQRVVIDEAVCIGCTKCIQACPVDAILGAAKQMHAVIADDCNGCELCIDPCPMDCIYIEGLPTLSSAEKTQQQAQNRRLFSARQARLSRLNSQEKAKHSAATLKDSSREQTVEARKAAIAAALSRVKQKKQP